MLCEGHPWDIHILIPQKSGIACDATDAANEYGKEAQRIELLEAFRNLNRLNITFHDVTLENLPILFCEFDSNYIRDIVVLNLCDGSEIDGYPGISVVKRCEELGVAYTGADASFFDTTTSKIIMKQIFDNNLVNTPSWINLVNCDNSNEASNLEIFSNMHFPLVIKPAVAYSSCGITKKSVVWNPFQAVERYLELVNQQEFGSLILAEEFVNGPEFTVLVVGDYHAADGDVNSVFTYPAVERAFVRTLAWHEKLLTFDEYWSDEPLYYYQKTSDFLNLTIQSIAKNAYIAVKGTGYGRVDLRMDEAGVIQTLEVNSNCGLSNKDDSSVGNILQLSSNPFHKLLEKLFINAFARRNMKNKHIP